MSGRTLEGTGATPRSGIGSVVWYRPAAELTDPPADGVNEDEELNRFAQARSVAREELNRERERTAERVGDDEAVKQEFDTGFLLARRFR